MSKNKTIADSHKGAFATCRFEIDFRFVQFARDSVTFVDNEIVLLGTADLFALKC